MVAKKKPGSGGNNKRRLAGKGPTPKAEDRTYHPAAKRKAAAANKPQSPARRPKNERAPHAPREQRDQREYEVQDDVIVGRNPVLEALRAGIAVKRVMVARGVDIDERITEIVELAREARIEVIDINRKELDPYPAHQGVALRVAPYKFRPLSEVISKIQGVPLLVALDGVTDPRNLGAIIRSACAFGANAIVIPERRAAGMTAVAWKSSAGAAARTPVVQIKNMTATIHDLQSDGYFVVGLDAGGSVFLSEMAVADEPLVIVIGGEGKGLSRLVRESCDLVVSIPMSSDMESLNASVAAAIALYSVSEKRKK
jgi:23S rRNA (guanosine2251-2'-O)-methyltransferase